MPTPNKGEKSKDFVSRCIPIVINDKTAKDPAQATAICHSMFEEHQKKQKKSTYSKLCDKLGIKEYGCKE